ncbi:uncharacterized protein LOC124459560 isoform X2 [Xenia sp. Carnegie-2017]|uniref:uncharacterized protein LOC124459560 isoform X2 n=1 Tax=Xenia sp. Carnegie-2017 TaxID=2897299 RepID=UPI001F043603|nr:uncharacterized protein LOC124459560 isoform X2 [Xenia sp. Carnegie-2017]
MSLHTLGFLVILLPVINGSNITSLITSSMARTKIFQIAATKTAVNPTNTILSTTTSRTAAEVPPRVGRNSTFALINFPSSTPNTDLTGKVVFHDIVVIAAIPTAGKLKQDESNLPLIVGVAAPAVVIVLVIIVFIWFVNKRNKLRKLRSQVTICYEKGGPDRDSALDNIEETFDVSNDRCSITIHEEVQVNSRRGSQKDVSECDSSVSDPEDSNDFNSPTLEFRSRSGFQKKTHEENSIVSYIEEREHNDVSTSESDDHNFDCSEKGVKTAHQGLPKGYEFFERQSSRICKTGTYKRLERVEKLITTDGGVVNLEDVELNVGTECLAKDTKIELIKDNNPIPFQHLLDLKLVEKVFCVIKCLPNGLKFLKPANLSVRIKTTKLVEEETFVLHGSYSVDMRMTVWRLVTNEVNIDILKGEISMNIEGFSFYSYIQVKFPRLACALSHLNRSFVARAYVLYRRLPEMNTLDISVIFISEFVDKKNEKDIVQLADHCNENFHIGERGVLKRVKTRRTYKISLDFPGREKTFENFKMDESQLDSSGFVVDCFKGLVMNFPAKGYVNISEINPNDGSEKLIWKLNVCEVGTNPGPELLENPVEPHPPDVLRKNLTHREVTRISEIIAVDWDSLGGLLDIPYNERDEIRRNHSDYPDSFKKAEKILAIYNEQHDFSRNMLTKCFEEMGRDDIPLENVDSERITESTNESFLDDDVTLRHTRLSPRETYRLSRRIGVDWDSLAGLMDIANEERNNIQRNPIYQDDFQKAEKVLSMINNRKKFSRKHLVERLKEIGKIDCMEPILTGTWRSI